MVEGLASNAESFSGLFDTQQTIEVPLYQRGYSWKREQVETLWNDLVETFDVPANKQALFLGPVVFHIERRPEGTSHYLVDGQQRLTTLSIILAALRWQLKKFDAAESGAQIVSINRYLFKVDARTQAQIDPQTDRRLRLSKKDDKQFDEMLRTGRPGGKNTHIKKSWKLLNEFIEQQICDQANREKIADLRPDELKPLLRELAANLSWAIIGIAVFARIKVESPFDPLTVFESLNSKSLQLAQSDLIKNSLVQTTSAGRQQEVADEWDRLTNSLSDEIVNFLRGWFIAEHEHVQKRQLFNEISKVVADEAAARRRLDEWNALAPWYAAFVGVQPAPVQNQGLQELIRSFSMVGFRQAIPILMALVARGKLDLLQRTVRLLETFYVRVFKTANVRGSVFEKQVPLICEKIRANAESGIDALQKITRELILRYSADLDWENLRLTGKDLQRYVLVEIAKVQQGPTYRPPPPDVLEIEHISPQNPAGEPDDDSESFVNHIGNLTLILAHDNKRCGNKPFNQKKAVYAEYDGVERKQEVEGQQVEGLRKDLRMTAELAHHSQWTPAEIKARALQLAELADLAWPLPPA